MFAVLLVVFLEHLVIVLKIILTLAIPDMPAWVRATVRVLVPRIMLIAIALGGGITRRAELVPVSLIREFPT